MEPREAIAGYLRERRAAAGLTRAELARRAGISEGLIQKLEQGTRPPTSTALGALFDALDVPINYREYAANVLQPELTAISATTQAPSRAELDFLESIPYPACYQTVPALDLIAGNAAYRRAFPGLEEPGTNIMAWMLLHPVAREVIADWEREVHLMVHSFRHMAHGVTAPERIAEITELCARSSDWQRLWHTDIPPTDIPRRPVRIRPVEGGDWTPMYVQLLRCELPRRDWWVYSMVPLRGIRPAP